MGFFFFGTIKKILVICLGFLVFLVYGVNFFFFGCDLVMAEDFLALWVCVCVRE